MRNESCLNSDFGVHESPELRRLFRNKRPFPYQGAHPERATIFFLGLDANFPRAFEGQVFEQFKDYYLDPDVTIWKKNGIHHPFVTSCRGIVFHQILAEVFRQTRLKEGLAPHICFVELLDVPTYGSSSSHPQCFDSLLKKEHLAKVEALMLAPHRRVCTFLSQTVLRKIQGVCSDKFDVFRALSEARFTKESDCRKPIHRNGHANVYGVIHPTWLRRFSTKAFREHYVNRLADLIDSCVQRRSE